MTRMTAKDFAPEILQLYDGYAHGRITKREFLDRAASFAVGSMTAPAILAGLAIISVLSAALGYVLSIQIWRVWQARRWHGRAWKQPRSEMSDG